MLWAKHHLRAAEEALERQQFGQARQHLTKYLSVWPNSAPAHLLLAQTARRAGFPEEAERQLDICERLEEEPSGAVELERALLKVEQGDFAEEDTLWTRVEEDPTEAVLILESLTKGYRRYFLLGKMLKTLDKLLRLQPNNVYALLERGWVHERQFFYRLAISDYRQALEVDPDNEVVRLTLAQGLLALGEGKEALPLFEELRKVQPENPKVGLGLAQCRMKLGLTEQARILLDKLAAQFPNEAGILLERGRLALETGHRAEAKSWFRKAVAQAPHDYQANYNLLLCLNAGGPKEERKKYKTLVARIQKDIERLHDLTGELQSKPYAPNLRCEIGQIFLRNGAEKQGLMWLQSSLQIDPLYRRTHEVLADYYEEHHQSTLAERHRRKALQGKTGPRTSSSRAGAKEKTGTNE
jgi:tetratricopeptide (TPR) repeat protein